MVEVICDQCERINKQTAEYCDRCGAPLVERGPLSASETLSAETSGEQSVSGESALEQAGAIGSPTAANSTAGNGNGRADEPAKQAASDELETPHDNSDGDATAQSRGQEPTAGMPAGPGIGYQLTPWLIAIALTAVLHYYVANTIDSSSLLHSLMLPPGGGALQAIPLLIVFFFLWSIASLALRFATVRAQSGHLASEAVQSCPRRVEQGLLVMAHEQLRNAFQENAKSVVYGAVYLLLEQIKSTGDPQRSHALLRHQSQLDLDAVRARYRTIRVCIWSMVLLGFIGAVFAASLASGEVSAFQPGSIDDIAAAEYQSLETAGQLTFAFNTTLLGLTASLLVMLANAYVYRCEEGLHKDVEGLCLRIVSHAKVAEPDRSLEVHVENWFAELKQVLDSEASQRQAVFDDIAASVIRVGDEVSGSVAMLEASLGNIKTVFIGEMENSFRELASDIQRVGQDIAAASENFPIHIAKAQDSFAGEIDGALANVASRFESVGDQISGSYASLPGTLDNVQNQFANELKTQVESQIEGLKNFGAAFNASVTMLSASLTDMPGQLANAGQALEGSAAQVAQLKASIDAAADSSVEHTSAAQLLAQKVETLAISSEVTQQAVSSLHTLKSLMTDMQQSQAKITPLLNQLAGPHEIRIVPQQKTQAVPEAELVLE